MAPDCHNDNALGVAKVPPGPLGSDSFNVNITPYRSVPLGIEGMPLGPSVVVANVSVQQSPLHPIHPFATPIRDSPAFADPPLHHWLLRSQIMIS